MDKYELASFTAGKMDEAHAFMQGCEKVLQHLLTSSDDPYQVTPEFRRSGNIHIWLLRGRWVGPYEAEFPEIF